MSLPHSLIADVFERTNCRRMYTYPGSPPRYLYEAVLDHPEIELIQGVREQHLLHLAQNRYYKKLEVGEEEIPVVILSGDMGEAMASQPLLAGSMSSPCLVIVAESAFEHIDSSYAIPHQSHRGTTAEKLGEDADLLMQHDNVVDRVLLNDLDRWKHEVEELINKIRTQSGVGILHLPEYVYNPNESLDDVISHTPEKIDGENLGDDWLASERPVIIAGRGIKHPTTRRQVEKLAEESGAVIVASMSMEGYFDTNYVGRFGVIGDERANKAIADSDFVLSLGCSLNTLHTSLNPEYMSDFQSKVYQVEINKNRISVFSRAYVHADATRIVNDLPRKKGSLWFHSDQKNSALERIPEAVSNLGTVFREHYPHKVVNIGVGNTSMWVPYAVGSDVKKEISRSGSMGEIVGGLERDEDPILVLGDGEFEMDLSLITAAQYLVESATIFVVNNERLGLVTERQENEFGEILTPKQNPINYQRIGDAFENVKSTSVTNPDKVASVCMKAIEDDSINIVELKIKDNLAIESFDLYNLPGYTV